MIKKFATDIRLAVRSLSRARNFTTITVLTLGLGLGGVTAIMTLLDSVVLRPLAYAEPGRLVQVQNAVPGVGEGAIWGASTAQYVQADEEISAFSEVGLYRRFSGNVSTESGPVRISGWRVTSDLLPMLGTSPQFGRLFVEDDDHVGADRVLVISHDFWQSQFGSDPTVIGQTISLNGQSMEIVGVLPSGFSLPGSSVSTSQIYIPLQIDRSGQFSNSHVYLMIGRLAPGQSTQSADAVLQGTFPRLIERFPTAYGTSFFDRTSFRPFTTPLKDQVIGDIAGNLWILLGGVGLVLLIAVANVANLFLVRMDERRDELALRSALGAGWGVLARYLSAEALVLSASGAVVALAVSFWGVPALLALSPGSLPRLEEIGLSWTALLGTLILTVFCAVVMVAYPLGVHARGAFYTLRRDSIRSATASRSRQRFRAAFVITQVALALTLASGTGLLIKSVIGLKSLDPGFEPEGSMAVDIFLDPAKYENSDMRVWQAWRRITEEVKTVPGVRFAGLSTDLPLSGGFGCTVQGFDELVVYERIGEAGMLTCAGQTYATPGYFQAIGIPLLQGRDFENRDNDDPGRRSVVVSKAFADRFWPGEDPIGKGVAPNGRTEGFHRVIGIVGDIPRETMDGETAIAIYYPIADMGGRAPLSMTLIVRTELAEPLALLGSVHGAAAAVDPDAPVSGAIRLEDMIARSMARITFVSTLLQIAAMVALLLAAIGLYGVISYLVGRRTREIGMRLAIGAEPRQVQRQMVRSSNIMALFGLTGGIVLSLATARVLESLLYDVRPGDPVVLAISVVLLAGVSHIASWIPARRASRIDPVMALRAE